MCLCIVASSENDPGNACSPGLAKVINGVSIVLMPHGYDFHVNVV